MMMKSTLIPEAMENMHDYPSDDDSYYTSSGSDDDSYYTSSGEDEDQPDEYDLLVDDDYYWNVKDGKRMLLNLSHNRNKGYSMSLYETYGKACWGSRYGWIVILGLNRRMHLFNPLTKAQLPLPSQTTFWHHWDRARDKTIRKMFLFKVVVLQVPRDEQNDNVPWLVVAIQHSYLLVAVARPGDASWMQINCPDSLTAFMDVIYCNKMKFLVFLDASGELFTYDIHNSKQPQEFKEYLHGPYIDDYYDLPNPEGIIAHAYLAQSANDMFIIVRYKRKLFGNNYLDSNHNYKTEIFKVYRCSSLATNGEEVSEIGNVALFVGGNETMCIAASDGGCRSNCIYFSDDDRHNYHLNRDKVGGHDSGVFNLIDKSIGSIYDGNNSKSSYCPPFWFSPAI